MYFDVEMPDLVGHDVNKALQCSVIRVSEFFTEHRSSGETQPRESSGRHSPNKGCHKLTAVKTVEDE